MASLSGKVAIETHVTVSRGSDAAFVVVTGVRIDAHMDVTRNSDAAVAWPQAEMASSAAGGQPVDPAVTAPALTRPGRAGWKTHPGTDG